MGLELDPMLLLPLALVIVCKSDVDPIRAARKLERYGFANITVMKGGMFRWWLDRLPVERGG